MTDKNLILTDAPQRHLFKKLTKVFSADEHVKQVIQRGSFAKNESDRASDIDILLVVDDDAVAEVIARLGASIGSVCTLLTAEGWVDTIVPDFGGIGYVFLVKCQERLIQLDVYITPASWSERIHQLKEKAVLYEASGFKPRYDTLETSKAAVRVQLNNTDKEFQVIFEFLLVYVMFVKHLYRSRPTLALKYRYAMAESLAIFLRLVFVPEKIDYKMYDWDKDFRNISAPAVRKFERAIVMMDIYDFSQIVEMMSIFKTVLFETSDAHNEWYARFSPLIEEVEAYANNLLAPKYPS